MELKLHQSSNGTRPSSDGRALQHGVQPAAPIISSPWPQYEADEIAAVLDVLQSGRVNSLVHGDRCRQFEREFAAYCGMPHAISVANGTLALELALRALGVGPGDEVIVPARSFFASASCVIAVGASPVFADIDLDSHTLDVASTRTALTGRTRAIICVHLAGWPCAMDELCALAEQHGLWLIEDCAQAHGASYRGRRVGSFGNAAAFSFCTDKIMSTGGEGGMVLLRSDDHWARAWAYKDHGKNPYKVAAQKPSGSFQYLHDGFGSNFRMTEMQAAIGLAQLQKLPRWLKARSDNARMLAEPLDGHPLIRLPDVPPYIGHAFYKFVFRLDLTASHSTHAASDIVRSLQSRGVPASRGACPDMSRETAFAGLDLGAGVPRPVADHVGQCSIMLPVDHRIEAAAIEAMAANVIEVVDTQLAVYAA